MFFVSFSPNIFLREKCFPQIWQNISNWHCSQENINVRASVQLRDCTTAHPRDRTSAQPRDRTNARPRERAKNHIFLLLAANGRV
jgi:hypothetical protein